MAAPKATNVGKAGTTALPEGIYGVEVNGGLLHEVVRAEGLGRRQGTHATKTRGLVSGGRAKPYRQKGTGRARQGTTRAPQFTGGGVVFGPQPRSYAVKVNKKAYRKARCMGLSQHAAAGTLGIFDAASFSAPKTKDAIALLDGFGEAGPTVVVVSPEEEAAGLSFRNVPRLLVLTPQEVGVTELLWARRLLISQQGLEDLNTSLAPVRGERPTEEVTA
jgi:large subunit ribosomal protein L4